MSAAVPAVLNRRAAVRRGRFSANLLANLLNFGLNIGLGFWFVPYLVKNLGVVAYGLIPLVAQVIAYLGILTVALNCTVGRYLSIALDRGDDAHANRIFNTAFFGVAAVTAGLILAGALVVAYRDRLLRVPSGYEREARWLCGFAVATCALTVVTIPFTVSSFCRNRFDLQNLIGAGNALLRAGLVVLLFTGGHVRVASVGLATLAAAFFSAAGAVATWRLLTPNLSLSPRWFDARTLPPLLCTGGWIVVNQLGAALFLYIDLIVINRLFGAHASGRYAAVLQWSVLLRGLSGTVAGVFAPTILRHYNRGDIDGLVVYVRRAVKFSGLLLALPIGIICGLAGPLLTVWLGPQFADLGPLCVLLTLPLCVNLAVQPMLNIQTATDRVRLPGLLNLVLGVLNVFLALLLAGPAGWGVYGVAAAGVIVLGAKNTLFTPLYAARVLGRPACTFLAEMVPVAAATLGVMLACRVAAHFVSVSGWGAILAVACAVSGLFAVGVYALILTPDERRLARRLACRDRECLRDDN